MKKHVVVFLVFIMIFTLTACSEKSKGGSPAQGSAPTEASNAPSGEDELSRLKELYDGKWINEDPYDGPFNMEVLSTTSIKITYEATDSHICDLFYSAGELTSISVSLGGISLGKYSIDTNTRILTYRPNDMDVFTYTKG